MKTPIRCTRCGTVTTWTPYCPSCGAYLEFSGDPPWIPEPPEDMDAAPTPAEQAETDALSTGAATAPAEASADKPATAPARPIPAPAVPPPKPEKPARPDRRFGGVAPWWRFWGRRSTTSTAPAGAHTSPGGPTSTDQSDDAAFTYVVEAPVVPQTVAAEAPTRQEAQQRRTIPIGRADDLGVAGGLPCPNCKFRNYVDASYCARCGYTLRDSVPHTQALTNALAPSEKPPRRTDWTSVALMALVALVIGWILLAPPSQPIRQFFGDGVRAVAYWVDPDLGTPVIITNVTASSTGYGYPPTSVIGDDATSFWASAPGPSWGAGSTLTFTLSEPVRIDRMVLRPGIQNGQFAVRALATPENLTLVFTELDSDTVPSASPSPTFSSASPFASPTSSASPSPSGSGTASPSPTASAPTPTATPSVQASLPVIVEPPDWASVVTFPAVYTNKVILRIDSVYPPALPDVYAPGGGGQVAITGIQFLPMWTLADLFDFDFREPATKVPSPTPSAATSGSPSPAPSPSPSATP